MKNVINAKAIVTDVSKCQGSHAFWKVLDFFLQIFPGFRPDPTGGAYSAPPDLLAGGPQEPHPHSQPFGLQDLFIFLFKHLWAPKKSWKISHGGPGKSWIFCQ